MNQPLGNYAGLRCEILESIDCLNGNGTGLDGNNFRTWSKILMQVKSQNNQMAIDVMLDSIENKSALINS